LRGGFPQGRTNISRTALIFGEHHRVNVINSCGETAAATRGGPNEEQVGLDGRAIKAKMGGAEVAEKRDADQQIMGNVAS
jgi:hypothetical protein